MRFEDTNVYNMLEAIRAARLSYGSKGDSFWDTPGSVIGRKDEELIKKLIAGGPSHRKFMRQILLSVDITAPRYWWTQFDTYKVGVVTCSESTMHTLMKKPITKDDFAWPEGCEHDGWDDYLGDIERVREWCSNGEMSFEVLVAMLPQSYKQKRHVTMNYEVVRNIREQRAGHKLPEWKEFIEWSDTLPYADLFFGGEKDGEV